MKAQVRLWANVQAVVDVEGMDGEDCIRKAIALAPNGFMHGEQTIIHRNNGVTYRLASEYENCLLTPELMPDMDLGFEPIYNEDGSTEWVEETSEKALEMFGQRAESLEAMKQIQSETPDPLENDRRPYREEEERED